MSDVMKTICWRKVIGGYKLCSEELTLSKKKKKKKRPGLCPQLLRGDVSAPGMSCLAGVSSFALWALTTNQPNNVIFVRGCGICCSLSPGWRYQPDLWKGWRIKNSRMGNMWLSPSKIPRLRWASLVGSTLHVATHRCKKEVALSTCPDGKDNWKLGI